MVSQFTKKNQPHDKKQAVTCVCKNNCCQGYREVNKLSNISSLFFDRQNLFK